MKISYNSRCYFFVLGVFLLWLLHGCTNDNKNKSIQICDKDEIQSPFLASVYQAKGMLEEDTNTIPIYVCKSAHFAEGRIPNSLNLWRPDFRTRKPTKYGGLMCTKEELDSLLSKLGVSDKTMLLIYDDHGAVDAFRFAWVLEYYGFDQFKVINGGLESWKRAGYPLEKEQQKSPVPMQYVLQGQANYSIMAHLEEVKSAMKDPSTIIVDTREDYEYLGQPFIQGDTVLTFKEGAFASGTIPGAVHFNWSMMCDLHGDHRIKCPKDLWHDVEKAGISPDKKIIVFCQSGSRSSHTAFVLRHILGFPEVKNYDGSWIEWSYLYKTMASVDVEQKTDASEVVDMHRTLLQQLQQ